jgi:F-type H+-transporting ATPase subunit delta
MSLAIANRYARALADAVLSPGSGLEAPSALAQLSDFNLLLGASSDLRNVLLSPAVPASRKRAVVAKLGEPLGLHKLIRNFRFVVIDHRRAGQLNEIVAAFELAIDERLGRVRAKVSSPTPLAGPERDSLHAQLARMTGKQVRCEFQVDPNLLGGVSVRIGSTIYDGSVRGQLESLRRRLAAE